MCEANRSYARRKTRCVASWEPRSIHWRSATAFSRNRDRTLPPGATLPPPLHSTDRLAFGDDLRQERGAALGLVDPVLDQAGGRDIVMPVHRQNVIRA